MIIERTLTVFYCSCGREVQRAALAAAKLAEEGTSESRKAGKQ